MRYYKRYIHLPSLREPGYAEIIAEDVAAARSQGWDICLQFDWHVIDPFHAPPPHLYDLVGDRRVSDMGLGYAPFGWTKGWVWAMEQMASLIDAFRPEAILYGDRPHYRAGWGFLNGQRDPAVAAYNDTLGILKEALFGQPFEGGFPGSEYEPGVLIIPETFNSDVQKRGIQRAEGFFPLVRKEQDAVFVDVLPVDEDEEGIPDEELEDALEILLEDEDQLMPELPFWDRLRRADRIITAIWDDYPLQPMRSQIRAARRQLKKALGEL